MIPLNKNTCFEQGLLRKGPVDKNKIQGALKISQKFLNDCRAVVEIGRFRVSMLTAYNSMFHSARALLFKNGITERSHFCMILYLKDKYKTKPELSKYLDLLDNYRQVRHSIQYGGASCTEVDANEALKDAKNFLRKVKEIINQ